MLSTIGSILIGFSLFSTLYSVFALWYGIYRKDKPWEESGQRALVSSAGLLLLAAVILIIAFLTNQFQIAYVAQHSSRALPFYLKLTAIWAGQEGSLLLWAFLQALFAAIIGRRVKKDNDPLSRWAAVILGFVSAFFIAMTLIFSNPFLASTFIPVDGQGMNPLLRHPGMVFHPPILYIGYVGLAVPFAYAIASLITNQVGRWFRSIRHWLLISWLALGIGILLGSRWAYDVLGWGGYWGWDAVENAGLMPWLTATALLHGIAEQKRGKGFKVWNILLAAFSFALVLFGTFTTRSGMIQSVHAFTRSRLGPYFLVMIFLTLIGTFLLLLIKRKTLGEIIYPEKVFSREGASFFTLILLLLITLSILAGTLLPTVTNGRFSAPPSWFNRVVGPQLGALVLLMGVCPILGRFGRAIKASNWYAILPILGLILTPVLAFFIGMAQIISLIGFAIAGFAGGTAIGEVLFYFARRKKSARNDKSPGRSQPSNLKRLGGLLVHFGIVLIAVGVIGTQLYETDQNITLSPGEFAQVGEYNLLYEDLFQETSSDHLNTWAEISVYRNGSFIKRLQPAIAYYPAYDQAMGEPAIRSSLVEDLYLVMFQWDDTGAVSLNVRVNPLSSFLWLGGLILIAGGIWAWWPEPSTQDQINLRRHKRVNQIFTGLGAVILILILFSLWGNPFSSTGTSGRPLPGESAPVFNAQAVDGQLVALDQYRGNIVVLHFWASWCPQCEDELRQFERVWESIQDKTIVFLGVAMNDDQSTVSKIASDWDLTFPLIPDTDGRISQSYGVTAVPETFIINPDGTVASFQIGVMDITSLETQLESIW